MTSTAKRIEPKPPVPAAATVKVAVWDLPVRLFHWALVGLIAFSWWSAENGELELHLWSGYAILALIIFRVMWGLFGSSTARFANFIRGPRAVLAHVRNSRAWRSIGHSPLGALSVLAMLVVLKLQVATGLVNADDDGLTQGALAPLISLEGTETAHWLHDKLFDLLLILIGLHVGAILYHRIVRGKRIVGPMINGRAEVDPETTPMRAGKWWVALACLAAAIGVSRWVIAGAPPFG